MKVNMDITDKIEYWIELSDYDIDVANSLYESKKNLYVGYFCHLFIEKILKAYYCFSKENEPPYTHNLLKLANSSELINLLNNKQLNTINELIPLNIEGRYPTDKKALSDYLTNDKLIELLNDSIEMQKWIKSLIKY